MPKSNSINDHQSKRASGQAYRPAFSSPEDLEKKESRPIEPPETGDYMKKREPLTRIMTILAAGLGLLMTLVITASYSNRTNYYLRAAGGALEIWQGRFAPVGRERILILPGAQPPAFVRAVYTKNEINAIAFNYYIDRADMLLEAPDMPDFNGIKLYLKTALSYGVTAEMRRAAYHRLNNVDMMIYLYKADVAASKGNLADFKKALEYMAKAAALDLDTAQTDLVNKKIQSIKELMAALQDKDMEQTDAPPVPQSQRSTAESSEK
ncbi:MAG: hypothetical protein AB1427_19320 [Thermodesulfobacteriota bacterium]